jgi:hypothetical protein
MLLAWQLRAIWPTLLHSLHIGKPSLCGGRCAGVRNCVCRGGGEGGGIEFCRVMKPNFAESLINISFRKNVGERGGRGKKVTKRIVIFPNIQIFFRTYHNFSQNTNFFPTYLDF